MRTNKFSHIVYRGQRAVSSVVRSAAMAVIAIVCFGAASTASAVTWTVGEIVQAIQQAQANGQPFDRLLAQKVQEELAKANFRIIENNLVYQTAIPATSSNLRLPYDDDPEKRTLVDYMFSVIPDYLLSLGVCQILIPEGSLINVRSSIADISATFYPGSYIGFKTNPSNVILTLGLSADTNASANLGLEWCGVVKWPTSCQQWAPNPLCPPPYYWCDACWYGPCNCGWVTPSCPFPDVCVLPGLPSTVEESWTDWASVQTTGHLTGTLDLELNHSLRVADGTVTVGLTASVSGNATHVPTVVMGPVIPDIRPIAIPVPPFLIPHVGKSPVFQALVAQTGGAYNLVKATFAGDYAIREFVMDKVAAQAQVSLNNSLSTYFPITLQLPTIQDFNNLDPASQVLVKWVLDYLRNNLDVVGEHALDVVRQHWTEVLYYVLTDNREALVQFFGYQALCPSLEQFKSNMPTRPLYSTSVGSCAAISPRAPGSGPYYSDASCQQQVSFQVENFSRFCQEALTPKPNPLLGNAAAWPSLGLELDTLSTAADPSTKWSLATGAQLAVGVEPIQQNNAPYVKRINYRQVENCALEMRVYKKDIGATNLTPLLWIHGGAWTYRSSGFLGLESLVSSYTEDGFVVFAPFYRLAGDKDGSQECRNTSWDKMASDAEAALAWVKTNGVAFGARDTTKIAVTGQSAGAHLAGWLMTHRPADVGRGMLVYPPTDLRDFLARLQGASGMPFPPLSDTANTPYDPSSAQDILETLLQLPKGGARTVNLNSPPAFVTENSYADIVRTNPAGYPPSFILHGTRDSLLTYSQSQVLCESYGGVVNVNWSATQDLRAVYACGERSELHLFKEADHAFEVCPSPLIPSACRAGSAASAELLTDSLRQGRQWLHGGELRVGVPVIGLAGAPAKEMKFTFDVPAGVYGLAFQMNGGSGDADLYVRYGAQPTTTAYDCRPYTPGNSEFCAMPATAGRWYVTVRGYTDFAGINLQASYSASPNYLQNGLPVTGLAGAFGSVQSYMFQVPAGAKEITFAMSGGTGDADLYVRHDLPPTSVAYECRPYVIGNKETCTMRGAAVKAGVWYVVVRSFTAFSGVALQASYQ